MKFMFFLGRILFTLVGLSCIVIPSFIPAFTIRCWDRVVESAALDLLYIPNLGLLTINAIGAVAMLLSVVSVLIYAFYFVGSIIWACYTKKWALWKDIWYHNK